VDLASGMATLLTSPVLAAYGPWGVVMAVMGFMLTGYFRGREARLAQLNDRMQESLREDQRVLWERQAEELESTKVDLAAAMARLRETEALCSNQRVRLYDQYREHREAYHAANAARQQLIAAGLATADAFPALTPPAPPVI